MRLNKKSGMTLVEVLVSFAIFSILLGALYVTYMAGQMSFSVQSAVVNSQAEARKAIIYLSTDLRMASGLNVTSGAGTISAVFFQSGIGLVTYSWSTSGADANRILRQRPSDTRIIARDITSFNIVNGTDDIDISVTATSGDAKGEYNSFSLSSKVAKR